MAATQVRGQGQVQVSLLFCQQVTEWHYWESDMSVFCLFIYLFFVNSLCNIQYRAHWPHVVLNFALNQNNLYGTSALSLHHLDWRTEMW